MTGLKYFEIKPTSQSVSRFPFLPWFIKVRLPCLTRLHIFPHSNRENKYTELLYLPGVVCLNSLYAWLTHCTIALLSATGQPMLNHSPHPSPAQLPFLLKPPRFIPPFLSCLKSLWVWMLERGQLTQQPVQQTQVVEEGNRESQLTSLHSDLHTLPPSWLNLTLRSAANHKWGWSASHPMALATLCSALALSPYSFQQSHRGRENEGDRERKGESDRWKSQKMSKRKRQKGDGLKEEKQKGKGWRQNVAQP